MLVICSNSFAKFAILIMGCGASRKKIVPEEEFGKILLSTGVPEFDGAYNDVEDLLKLISH